MKKTSKAGIRRPSGYLLLGRQRDIDRFLRAACKDKKAVGVVGVRLGILSRKSVKIVAVAVGVPFDLKKPRRKGRGDR